MFHQRQRICPAETNSKNLTPPSSGPKEIFTSRKQGIEYFTTEGVIERTGYTNKADWYQLPIREILDNCIDFLWKNYKGSDKTFVETVIEMDDEIFRLKIRSSNHNNAPAFGNLEAIFDYSMRYGSKQDMHIISRGMLGDAMKQILSLGYVLLHISDDGTQFEDKQWTHPLIIRYNYQEWNIHLTYHRATQSWDVKVGKPKSIPSSNIEIELELPVIDEVKDKLTRDYLEEFCRKYTLFTTDISFKFSILDDINHNKKGFVGRSYFEKIGDKKEDMFSANFTDDVDRIDLSKAIINKLSKGPDRAILHIDLPALHPISADWKNIPTAHSYKPEEFIRRLTGVHDKGSTTVYDMLSEFVEGTQIKKTQENGMLISELVSSKNRDKLMEKWYDELRAVFNGVVQSELGLPYTDNAKKRREALYSRVQQSKFYDIDTTKRYSYALIRGLSDNTALKKIPLDDGRYTYERNKGIIRYPFVFEILAIPLKDPLIQHAPARGRESIFVGAINYSVSPKVNYFPGTYGGMDKDIFDILFYHGGFHKEAADTNIKIPCVIIGNLITPRRDPIGKDKSTIDITPFSSGIIEAVRKMSKNIQTYGAIGHRFSRMRGETVGKFIGKSKVSGKEILRQFLIKEGRLPDVRGYG
jgi:hypothetical protein